MAPMGWASASETALLTSLVPEYEKCQAIRQYKPFWTFLYARFLEHSPLIDTLYPGRTTQDLNEEEMAVYSTALEKLQQRLREWYRWRCNVRSRKVAVGIPKKILKSIYSPRTRGPKAYEAYAKLYPEEVHAAQEAQRKEEGPCGKNVLRNWHTICKELYSAASEEKLRAIDDYVETTTNESKLDGEEKPKDPKRYLQILPAILKAAIEPAVRKVDLMALITLVGPVPGSNGKISAWTLQFGDKEDTPLFSSSWVDHDRVYVEAVARFAKRHLFPSGSTSTSKEINSEKREISPSHAEPTEISTVASEASEHEKEDPEVQGPTISIPSASRSSSPYSVTPEDVPNSSPSAGSHLDRDLRDFDDDQIDEGPGLRLPSPPAFRGYPPQSAFSQEGDMADSFDMSLDHCNSLLLGTSRQDGNLLGQGLNYDSPDLIRMSAEPHEGEGSSKCDATFQGMAESAHPISSAPLSLGQEHLLAQKHSSAWDYSGYPTPSNTAEHGLPSPQTISAHSRSYLPLPSSSPITTQHFYSRGSNASGAATGNMQSHHQRTPTLPFDYPPYSPYRHRLGTFSIPPPINHNRLIIPEVPFSESQPKTPFIASQPIEYPPYSNPSLRRTPPDIASSPETDPHTDSSHSPLPPAPPGITSLVVEDPKAAAESRSTHGLPDSVPPVVEHAAPPDLVVPVAAASALPLPLQNTSPTGASAAPPTPSTAALPISRPSIPAPVTPTPNNGDSASPVLSSSKGNPPSRSVALWTAAISATAAPPNHIAPAVPSRPAAPPKPIPVTPNPPPIARTTPPAVPSIPNPEPPAHPDTRTSVASTTNDGQASPALASTKVNVSSAAESSRNAESASGNALSSSSISQDSNTASTGVRRSGRGIVPSKTREKLQQIGTNHLFYPPPAKPKDDPLTPPGWFLLATGDLRDPKLGGEWVSLVDKWASLEESMGYGKVAKGPMPVKGRPEEWTKWTNKSAHGARQHSRPPFIDDPAEIGISITKWWKDIQPQFRASDGPLPAPIWTVPDAVGDAWTSIRKSGPNGTLPLMMLLLWWGRAAAPGPDSFREDSRNSWKALVADVSSCFDILMSTGGCKEKRRLEDPPAPAGSSKKARHD
ncbi:hypothetical protein DFP72DRAFT_1078570 [Ephemerocybe angulata]|uniref:Uncharacterized protein n=2 Tax=Ephemerocybe angulata TaxID=980116 RepID=A0A8H6LWA1_9AGAR|nr:hypothetical protein DFP72DRAFT_1078570 [Tulosesus angulatus]